MKLAVTIALSAAALLSGCSSYSGQKLGYLPGAKPGTTTAVKPTGVPYQLVRPEYMLSFSPPAAGETNPTYTVSRTWEPDPDQQYSLNLSPGFLADPDLAMTFGQGGTLTSSKSVMTEQVTPSIKALGGFATTLAGYGVFDKATSLKDSLTTEITTGACTDPSGFPELDRATLAIATPKAGEALLARLTELAKDDVILARFHFRTEAERACLRKVRDDYKVPIDKKIKDDRKLFDDAVNPYGSDRDFVTKITGLVSKNDQVGFRTEVQSQTTLAGSDTELHALRKPLMDAADAVMKAQDPAVQKTEATEGTLRARKRDYDDVVAFYTTFITDLLKIVDENNQDRFKAVEADQTALETGNPARYALREPVVKLARKIMATQKPNAVLVVLTSFADMSNATWRGRQIQYLEDRIERGRLALQLSPTAAASARLEAEKHVKMLEAARIEAIGATELDARRARLVAFLDKAPFTPGPAGATSAEYAVARTELDSVNEKIDALRTKVLAAAKPSEPKAAPAFKDVRVVRVNPSEIEKSKSADWDKKVLLKPKSDPVAAPAFVLVLEPVQ